MTASSIPVDLFNPGQVFACLGFMEAALKLHGEVAAGFDWSEPGEERFWMEVQGQDAPFADVLKFLAEAEVATQAPPASELDTTRWSVSTVTPARADVLPIPQPGSPATLPAVMRRGDTELVLAHWGDGSRRDNVKFWAGSGGYPGAALLRDALLLIENAIASKAPASASIEADPFSVSAPQSSSFRFDWRRDYIPLDAGFSLNEHTNMTSMGYPVVEVLAAVGLTHARPRRETKLRYRYGVVGRDEGRQPESHALLPPPLLRAALGTEAGAFPSRRFTMFLDWPGQENQARCITNVIEEPSE